MKKHVMNIKSMKLHLMRLILQTNDEKLLSKVKEILGQEEADWWDEMSEEEKEDIKEGHLHSQDEVQKMIEDWTKEQNP
jgi:hypothetical protein